MTVILQYLYIYIFIYILFVLTFSWHEAHSLHHVAPGRLVKGARREKKMRATDEEEEAESVMAGVSSVSRWGKHWTRLDFKNKDVKMAGNLVANTDAVTQQVEKGNDLREEERGGKNTKCKKFMNHAWYFEDQHKVTYWTAQAVIHSQCITRHELDYCNYANTHYQSFLTII